MKKLCILAMALFGILSLIHFQPLFYAAAASNIYTAADLDAIRDDLQGIYDLQCDIDLSDTGWIPIEGFSGTLDGQGHSVVLKGALGDNLSGLFQSITGGTVRNLLVFADINSPNAPNVGGIAAFMEKNSRIEYSGVIGTIVGGEKRVGGLAGFISHECVISNCFANVQVFGSSSESSSKDSIGVGGIVGGAWNFSYIENCYATGSVKSGSGDYIGGIAGDTLQGCAFKNCYYNNNSRPFVDRSTPTWCYSANTSNVNNVSTNAMKTAATYSNWDFNNVWTFQDGFNDGFPVLRVMSAAVSKPLPTAIAINPTGTLELVVGSVLTLKATLTPQDADAALTWGSSNPACAEVSQTGLVTPVKDGTARITCTTSNGVSAYVDVIVSAAPSNSGTAPDFLLPAALETIEDEAFRNAAFCYAVVPEGVKEICARAFADCPSLKNIAIPASTTTIAPDAFEGVTGLTIHGADGSYAEFYAGKHGFAFKAN